MLQIRKPDWTGYNKPDQWCVPTAVALITGVPVIEAASILARIAGKPLAETEGHWGEEALLAFGELGFRATAVDIPGRYPERPYGPTLKRYMRERRDTAERFYPTYIRVDGHALVAHMDHCFDNAVQSGAHHTAFPKPNRLVKSVHIVTPR